jgi:tRNA threonylcarbamoyladenosine biosynthesis protein TsaE
MQKDFETEEDLLLFAGQLARELQPGLVIYLQGDLGAGKTTLTRGIFRALHFHDKVKSPTYTLVEQYEIDNKLFYHFDLYRLINANELEHIGIKEYFTPHSICIIEWPEKGAPLLPKPDLILNIEFLTNGRRIKIDAMTDKAKTILERLN